MSLLKKMERLYKEEGELGMKPNGKSFESLYFIRFSSSYHINSVSLHIIFFCLIYHLHQVYTYSACINAFAKSEDPDAPKHAEALLEDMKTAYAAGDMDVKPNVVNYNSVINAWGRCKSNGSAQRAAEILKSMEKDNVEADALSYSLVVSAWAHSLDPQATHQAEVALGLMENWAREKNKAIDQAFDEEVRGNRYYGGNQGHHRHHYQQQPQQKAPTSIPTIRVHLDVDCYNTVLIALSKRYEADAADRAIAIVRRMNKLADEGFETVRPNAKSWNSVLNALSRSNDTNAAQRAEDALCEMNSAGIAPDAFSYAALLHSYQKNTFPGSAQRADDIVRKMEQLYFDGKLASGPDVYHYTIGTKAKRKCLYIESEPSNIS